MVRIAIIVAGSLAFVLALAASPQSDIEKAPLTWSQASLADGQALYRELCAVCHGVDATGNGPAAPALSAPTSDLTRLARDHGGAFPAAEVRKAINGEAVVVAHGSREMPVWGRVFHDVRPDFKPVRRESFARARVDDLVAYLESIQTR